MRSDDETANQMMDDLQGDICRVCRCEGAPDRQLFHPCICTGSIKWIHQECLMQWMRYSRKEFCELCGHKFSFTNIYSPDMPRVLPLRDLVGGLLSSVFKAFNYWLHYTLVVLVWLGIVPLAAYRTYRFLFDGSSADSLSLMLFYEFFSTENITSDIIRGGCVMACTFLLFIGVMLLREQMIGGGPEWLDREDPVQQPVNVDEPENADAAAAAEQDAADGAVDAAVEVENNNNINNNNNNNNNNVANNEEPQQAVDAAAAAVPIVPVEANGPPPDVVNEEDVPLLARNMDDGVPLPHVPINPAEPPPLPAAADAVEEAADADAAGGDDANRNQMEWDRAAEELTFERLLGLDGSMVFLEYVLYVISMNTITIFVFAFVPFSIGNLAISFFGVIFPGKQLLYFHGLLTTLVGYCIIGISLIGLHAVARCLKFVKLRRVLGMCYIVVKVSLLSVVELGALPLLCGWWLDICSLPVFDATLKDRKASFRAAPGTNLFLHWMYGMIYAYYNVSFILILREVLRPGVLWFLRNYDDPHFNPIQEMIHLSILRHTRRFVASTVFFGTIVILTLWVPIQILKYVWPSFLPYTLSGDSEINELNLQLLLLQIVLPGFFEQTQTRIWMKGILRLWFSALSWALGIRSYLLPADEPEEGDAPPRDDADQAQNNLGAAHRALFRRGTPIGYQEYDRPNWFMLRLIGLLVMTCIGMVIGSLFTLTVPVWIGRHGISMWNVENDLHQLSLSRVVSDTINSSGVDGLDDSATAHGRPHELYTAALGIYMCWILSRGISIAVNLFPQGRGAIVEKLKQWASVATSYAMAFVIFILLLGVVPMLFGLLLELVVIIPLRLSFIQTPIFFLWQDWALGVLYTKIACVFTLMGPDWAFRRAIERAFRDGIRDIDQVFIFRELAAPVIASLGLALAVPYVLAHIIARAVDADAMGELKIMRCIYPTLLIIAIVVGVVFVQIRQFRKFYVNIKNDKYLVGQRLVNYDHQKKKQEAAVKS